MPGIEPAVPPLHGSPADDAPEVLVIRGLLDRWADAIARHDPGAVADVFTPDALFQGFDPTPGYGRQYISAYYDKQPIGLTADYELLSVRVLAPTVTVAYASVLFERPDGPVPVYLTVVARKDPDASWALTHYHVSPLMGT
ncbi:MAG TPA: SgcJ/EcaC family oxidoreductase [Acidimicrobiales bacterium]